MNTQPLGKLTSIKTGKLDVNAGHEDGIYPFFTCASAPFKINEYAFDNEAILIAGNGDLNVKYYTGKFNAYQRTYVIEKRVNTELSMKYLYYFMETYMGHLRKNAIGGIIKYIKLGHLTEAKIPLPPINDQIRIAHLLAKVEGLIAQRKQQLQQLDDLLKSVFLELFGDPIRNEKGWDKKPLGKLLSKIDSGWSPKCEAIKAPEEQWGILKLSAVTSGEYKPEENKAMFLNVEPKIQHEVKAGDLLFSRKNTYELVAATAYVYKTRPMLLLPDLIFRLVVDNDEIINPIYLWKLLSFPSQRKRIQSLAFGAAGSMPNISKSNLKLSQIPVPNIKKQLEFVKIVKKVEGLRNSLTNSLEYTENLYGALSQKAFKGELDLTAIPLPEEPINQQAKGNKISVDVVELPPIGAAVLAKIDEFPMDSAKGRAGLLQQWFTEFAQGSVDAGNTLEHFWQLAAMRGLDYSSGEVYEESSEPAFSTTGFSKEDYDNLKEWIFKQIKQGVFQQNFDADQNKIDIKMAG